MSGLDHLLMIFHILSRHRNEILHSLKVYETFFLAFMKVTLHLLAKQAAGGFL
jgi:hypothetical protein